MPFNSNNDLRRSQIVTTFGVGATYDYVDFPGMTMSVDKWDLTPDKINNLKINNQRFVDYLNIVLKNFENSPRHYINIRKLVEPPVEYDQYQPSFHPIAGKIPVSIFPEWSICMSCNALMKHSPIATSRRCSNPRLPKWKKGSPCNDSRWGSKTEPVRFISFCQKGHIQDINWDRLMSTSCDDGCKMLTKNHSHNSPSLYLDDNGTGAGFSSLRITCAECGKSKPLTGINKIDNRKEILDRDGRKIFSCDGKRPWLGDSEKCDEIVDVQPRGASKIYLPIHKSAIFVPDPESIRSPLLDDDLITRFINKALDNPDVMDSLRDTLDNTGIHEQYSLDLDQATQIITTHFSKIYEQPIERLNSEELDKDFLYKEYQTLIQDKVDDDDFIASKISLDSYKNENISNFFSSLHQVKKVKTATALLGFERQAESLSSVSPEEKFNAARELVDFLPCIEVTGEGIFIDFGYEKISSWLDENPYFLERANLIKSNAKNTFLFEKLSRSESFDPGYVMIHSFSHSLMNQLAAECGYGITELLERIYYSKEKKMAGLLIYTASADSSGSLGGLVRMIKPELFENLLHNAIENSRFCSNDPICSDSKGQALNGMNLAGCHACLMVPDLACCSFPKNILLDRNLLTEDSENAKGYFLNI